MEKKENTNGVEVAQSKQFKLVVRFNDGEKDGRPHDRVYGFAVEADSEAQAKLILRKHLLKCVEELDKDNLREAQGILQNNDTAPKTTS